jgi:uncharacterized protein YcgI (DUF1989 family)
MSVDPQQLLRERMVILVLISNCPYLNASCGSSDPYPTKVVVWS